MFTFITPVIMFIHCWGYSNIHYLCSLSAKFTSVKFEKLIKDTRIQEENNPCTYNLTTNNTLV